MGMSLKARMEVESDYRYFIHKNWLIFYKVEGEWISIGRVLDGRSDYLGILFGNENTV